LGLSAPIWFVGQAWKLLDTIIIIIVKDGDSLMIGYISSVVVGFYGSIIRQKKDENRLEQIMKPS